MRITINGAERETEARNLDELAREEKAPDRGIAIARNGAVVRHAEWPAVRLEENDRIELIRAVQGG